MPNSLILVALAGAQAALLPPSFLGAWESPRQIVGEEAGERCVVVGGERALVGPGGARWADDRFGDAIVGAVRVAGGWQFTAADGVVARSATFLGPLRRTGRAVDAFASLRGHPAQTAFADDKFGAVVRDDGRLLRTVDGGQVWRVVPKLTAMASWELTVSATGITVKTHEGFSLLQRDGDVRDTARPDRPPAPDDAETASLRAALLARWPELAFASASRLLASPERILLRGAGMSPFRNGESHATSVIWGLDRASGRALPDRVVDQLGLPRDSCEVRPWGPAILGECWTGEEGTSELFRSADGASFQRIPGQTHYDYADRAGPVHTLLRSQDGSAVAWMGACAPRWLVSQWVAPTVACVVTLEGGAWKRRTVSVPRDTTDGLDLSAKDLLVSTVHGPVAIDFRTDDAREVREKDGRCSDLRHFGADGALVSWPCAALPKGAVAVDFADQMHGFAGGASLAEVWSTTDGGKSWASVAVSVDGQPSAVPLAEAAHCDAQHCLVGGRLLLTGWSAAPDAPRRTLVAAEPPPAAARRRKRLTELGVRCTLAPKSRPAPQPSVICAKPDASQRQPSDKMLVSASAGALCGLVAVAYKGGLPDWFYPLTDADPLLLAAFSGPLGACSPEAAHKPGTLRFWLTPEHTAFSLPAGTGEPAIAGNDAELVVDGAQACIDRLRLTAYPGGIAELALTAAGAFTGRSEDGAAGFDCGISDATIED